MMKVLFLLTVVLPCVRVSVLTDYYIAAVVEFLPEVDHSHPGLLRGAVLNNIRKYEELIAEAKSHGADIIVFPENGLMTIGLFEVPHPHDAVSPCLQSSELNPPMHHISCAARKNKIYVAFNLKEKNGVKSHITNVVFDRNGVVVSRYRKMHLFKEPDFQLSDEKDFGVFRTDFGVTFGVAICFDLLFREPASELVHTRNIRHFLYSTAWFSEMPFLTAVQFQAAWAWSHNSVLLASGVNNPEIGNTGSGIYAGQMGPITTLFCDQKTTQLLIGQVPKNLDVRDDAYSPRTAVYKMEMKSTGNTLNNIFLLKDSLEEFSSELLPVEDAEKDTKLCHGEFCCHFKIQTKMDNASLTIMDRQAYRLVVLEWRSVLQRCCERRRSILRNSSLSRRYYYQIVRRPNSRQSVQNIAVFKTPN